jgi:hypothetical protein
MSSEVNLIYELSVMKLALSDTPISAMEMFEFVREADYYPNIFYHLSNLIYYARDCCNN